MRKMMRIGGALVVMALMAVPAAAQGRGQGPIGAPMGRGMMQGGPAEMGRNPAAMVLEHRDVLDLTASQVERLKVIEARVAEQNGPRWERMRAAFGDANPREMSVEERQALRERMQALEDDRTAIRAINRSAGEEIHQLLTDEQEAQLRPLMHEGRGMRGEGGMRGDHPAQGRRGPRGHRGGGSTGGSGPAGA